MCIVALWCTPFHLRDYTIFFQLVLHPCPSFLRSPGGKAEDAHYLKEYGMITSKIITHSGISKSTNAETSRRPKSFETGRSICTLQRCGAHRSHQGDHIFSLSYCFTHAHPVKGPLVGKAEDATLARKNGMITSYTATHSWISKQ